MAEEKEVAQHKESLSEEHLDSGVDRGHAVDEHGAPFEFDRKAEARLRLKIDLCIVPTVALLYLFCFIDRANVGTCLCRYDYIQANNVQVMQSLPASKKIWVCRVTIIMPSSRYSTFPISSLKSRAI